MSHISVDTRGVQARFSKNEQNQPVIEFFDPAYARAEVVLYDPASHEVHALLHEGQYKLGSVPQDLEAIFGSSDSIMLCANHYAGHKVNLRAKLSPMS